GMPVDERLAPVLDGGVNDIFQRRELGRILKHDLREAIAIEGPAADRAREQLANSVDQRSTGALKLPHHRVGVEHGETRRFEHLRHRRLAHADGAGECDLDHVARRSRSRSAPRSGISGIPKMVKWSPSILSNSCTPRASSRNTPTV